MKKIRFSALLMSIVLSAGVLSSCSLMEGDNTGTENPSQPAAISFADIFNPDYTGDTKPLENITKIDELTGYAKISLGEYSEENDYIKVFKKNEGAYPTYKLFSMTLGKVVQTFADTAQLTHLFYTGTNYFCPAIRVQKNQKASSGFFSEAKYSFYDATGAEIANLDHGAVIYNYDGKFAMLDGESFVIDQKTGAMTKIDAPINQTAPSNLRYMNDKYIYEISLSSDKLCVSDRTLKVLAVWNEPSGTVEYSPQFYVLNNGNVLIQYKKELHPDATEYDLYEQKDGTVYKYDLVTEIFSVEEKRSTRIDFKYYIYSLKSREAIEAEKTGSAMPTFENIVTVYPIIENKISDNYADINFFTMDNAGVPGNSYKLVEYQTSLPTLISNGVYKVYTLYGSAHVDASGTVLAQMRQDYEIIGGYVVMNKGIYDLSFNLVYDFESNNAKRLYVSSKNAVFVKAFDTEGDESKYTVFSFSNGEKKQITRYDSADKNSKQFDYSSFGESYMLFNDTVKEIYSESGKLLVNQDMGTYQNGWGSVYAQTALCCMKNQSSQLEYYFVDGGYYEGGK